MPNKNLDNIPWVQLQFIFDSVFEGIIITDSSGIMRLINATAKQLHSGIENLNVGFPLVDCSQHDWLETRRVLVSGQALLGRKLVLADTELLVNRLPIIEKGEVVAVVTTMQDIRIFDNIVKQLPEYTALENEVTYILEQFGDAFVVLDVDRRILRVNAAYERLASLDRSALLGRNIHNLNRDPANIVPLIEQVFLEQQRLVSHTKYDDDDNFVLTASPSFDEQGEISTVFVRIQDVNQLLHLQERFITQHNQSDDDRLDERNHEIYKICQDTGIIANSPAMMRLVRLVLKASQAESSVLLQGESGVGKSMLAYLIHAHSPRKKHPFIVINAGAIPEDIMESELFGYVKGAFTGALPQGKIGLLEAANMGTLFLDEIGEMKYSMQAKLLEAIENKSFTRVGCTKKISVDIRIVAATNRNLEKDVEDGIFRRDLYYRLNVIPLYVPPLRERREDIQAMAQAILQQYNVQHSTKKCLSQALVRWFLQHDFSGNMRELINILEWMLVMGESNELCLSDLPTALQKEHIGNLSSSTDNIAQYIDISQELLYNNSEFSVNSSIIKDNKGETVNFDTFVPQTTMPLKEAMRLMEKHYLQESLNRYGNIQDTADALEVHFSTLWRKLTQYNIELGKL